MYVYTHIHAMHVSLWFFKIRNKDKKVHYFFIIFSIHTFFVFFCILSFVVKM